MKINGTPDFTPMPDSTNWKNSDVTTKIAPETKVNEENPQPKPQNVTKSAGFYDLEFSVEDKPDPIGLCSISTTCATCSCTCSCATCGNSCPWC